MREKRTCLWIGIGITAIAGICLVGAVCLIGGAYALGFEDLWDSLTSGEILDGDTQPEQERAIPQSTESSIVPFLTSLGTDENPIVWVLEPVGDVERIAVAMETVADMIFSETDLVVEPYLATQSMGIIEALCSDPPMAHMASLSGSAAANQSG